MTNYEKIMDMSMEELTDYIDGFIHSCWCCPCCEETCDMTPYDGPIDCKKRLFNWLDSEEVENDD